MKRRVVVTGAAGFIGMHLCELLVEQGYEVVGIDNLKPAYGGPWSQLRKARLETNCGIQILEMDLADMSRRPELVSLFKDSVVVHLAAWPGVKSSHEFPVECVSTNVLGFANVVEAVAQAKSHRFLFASSSSVYGDLGVKEAVREDQATGKNLKSFYASTKWMNEQLGKSQAIATGIPTVAMRFFSVVGEFGRPDMACWKFYRSTDEGIPVTLHGANGGGRNFTYVRDAVAIVRRLIESDSTGFEAVNVTCGEPIETIAMLNAIEKMLGKSSERTVIPTPDYDIEKSWADLTKIEAMTGHTSQTPIETVIERFSDWYTLNVKERA